MKTKKFLFAIAALLCVMAVTVTMTSCSSDDEDEWVTYTVDPDGGYDFLHDNCLVLSQTMNAALKNGMNYTGNVCKRDDSKAKSICDLVYQEIKNSAIGHFTLKLYVSHPSTNADYSDKVELATYNF